MSQSSILNLSKKDPFLDSLENDLDQGNVHIRVQQRKANSYLTTVQGLAKELDLKLILKAFKKNFHCNGSIQADPDLGKVVQLSGDQRQNVSSFLVDEGICKKDQIIIHGF
jgi:translation initiation factor 1